MKYAWVLVSPLVLAVTGLAALPTLPAQASLAAVTSPAASLAAASTASTASTAIRLPQHGFYWQLTAPQPVLPGTILVARGSHHVSRGTRSDREFFTISRTGSNDVPTAALHAYHHAEKVMASEAPGCQISWTLLAAIGRVESNHGRFGGAQLGADGVSRPEIRGPQLNGAGDFAAIADTDNGTLDRDKAWDRAVGQMQFLPGTWRAVGRDGDGDGTKNPDDIDDSALASAVYLCGAGGSLANQAGMARAAFRYNHSDYYVRLVLAFQSGYQTGVFAVPSPPPPPARKAAPQHRPHTSRPTPARHPHGSRPHATSKPAPSHPTSAPRPTPKPHATPKPAPKPKPAPSPSPAPAAPQPAGVDGTWKGCGPLFCLGSTPLDLGPRGTWGTPADADFDGDGAVESNALEFAGLVGQHVSLQVVRNRGMYVVYVINGHGFRNADGSFARAQAVAEPAS